MGFLFLAIKIPKAIITRTFLVNLLNRMKFMVIGTLTHLGLFKSPPEEDFYTNNNENSTNYVLILDGSSPSLVPIPVHVLTASIKKRLPILHYADFIQTQDQDDGDEEKVCTVCLDCIEGRHEVRQLFNCSHVFHRLCLDTWVDEGQVTCPLCRSMLLPPKKFLTTSLGGGGGGGHGGGEERPLAP